MAKPKGKKVGVLKDGRKELEVRKFKGKGSKATLYFVRDPNKKPKSKRKSKRR